MARTKTELTPEQWQALGRIEAAQSALVQAERYRDYKVNQAASLKIPWADIAARLDMTMQGAHALFGPSGRRRDEAV